MKDKKIIIQTIVFVAVIAILGLSYAYFEMSIEEKNVKDQIVTTGTLKIKFTDGPEIKVSNLDPGTVIEKTVTVENVGTLDAEYNLVWEELSNGIARNEMKISATCTMIVNGETSGEACEGIDETSIRALKLLKNVSISEGVTHKYDIKITFIETNEDQSYNLKKTFEGKLGVEESREITPVYCTFDGDMTQGAEFVNGQYTYHYMQERPTSSWVNIDVDGWGVVLNDRSSSSITSDICSTINDKPVVSMTGMYNFSVAKSVDLSTIDTSNVTNMMGMFSATQFETIDLSNFDTSNVTNMQGMFYGSSAKLIGLNVFDTSNVTNMSLMFSQFLGSGLDLNHFDTSKVTNMSNMFSTTNITELDLTGFVTSNVSNMSNMFYTTELTKINGLENFDTSKVTDMSYMFSTIKMDSLNLSSFDTSNVTTMYYMFGSNDNLKTIYVSNKFNVENVTTSSYMFDKSVNLVGGAGTVYDANNVDKTYARIDGGTSNPGYFTLKNN